MIDYPISAPPLPQPRIFPDEGVPDIPLAAVYNSGSFGSDVIDYSPSPTIVGGPDVPSPYNFLIVHSDGTEDLVNSEDVLADYDGTTDDDWSIVITVTNGATQSGSGNRTFNSTDTGFYDAAGSSQTKAIIPIYRSGGYVADSGVYKAFAICVNGSSTVHFIKV